MRYICALLFLAAASAADAAIVDDFGDGNDTTPAWSHFDPTAGATFAASSLSYLITVSATGNALDPARAFSLRQDAGFADVVVAADLVGFDGLADHSYGLVARGTASAAPTFDGYALVVTATGGIELQRIDAQVATILASAPVALSTGSAYRLELRVIGTSPVQLTGNLYAASDLAQPIATVHYGDTIAPLRTSGFAGLLVADHGALQDQDVSATFDDFFASAPAADSDADGLSDGSELAAGTDPTDPDTDDDGLLDGSEIGTGVFGPAIPISSNADGARMVMTADMDNDGDLDVVSGSWNDDTIAWHENDGTPLGPNWPEYLITTNADDPQCVFPADIDGDGDIDVIAASNIDYGVSWYENDGTPENNDWAEHPISANDSGFKSFVQKVSAADMDNDGDMDILTLSNPNDAFAWYENDGTPAVGVWTMHLIANVAIAMIAVDIDRDGNMDGLSTSQFNWIGWYENDGTPAVGLTEHQLAVGVGHPIRWVHAADFDGDGDVDVLSRSVADFIAWYENDGTPEVGAWPAHPVSSGPGSSISSFPWDADSDGDLDVLAAENDAFQVVWYENDGTPAVGAWTRHVTSASQYPEWVVAADLDGDGDEDALSGAFFDDTIAWYEQQNVADPLDPDSDDDGLLDGFEVANGLDPLDPGDQGQDPDGDGLTNLQEQAAGTNPNLADTDGDGLFDGFEVANEFDPLVAGEQGQDPDGDGLVNFFEQEAGTDPHLADTDGDGLLDGPEVANGLDPLSSDSDGDGLGDAAELNIHGTNPILADTDGDGLDDGDEINVYATNPLTPDSDADGLLDGFETAYGFNPLNPGEQGLDPDSDGLTNLQEQAAGTNPTLADSDADGLSDPDELNVHGTNPALADTDADGINDGAELAIGTDPLDPDSDNDGLSDGVEIGIGTNPLDPDMDDDGLSDGAEVNTHGTNPLVADTDGDGLGDGVEVNTHGTSPLLRDTDGDTMSDSFEIANGFDPLDDDENGNDRSDGFDDTDADGLANGAESAAGTDPTDPDTDDDGLLDGSEIGTGVFGPAIPISSNADGARMVMTADMDNDGDLDVVSGSWNDDTIAWHENDGTPLGPNWPEYLITTNADDPQCVFPADIDGDGDIDVIAASNIDYGVSWYENDGTPENNDWAEHPISANDSGFKSFVQKVSAADMDNDGDMDILTLSNPNDAFAWYENDGTPAVGVWTMHLIANVAIAMIAVDIDRDGNMDGLSTSQFNWIGWYENDGTPAVGLTEHQLAVGVGHPIRWVHAADFDGDGDVDVLSRSVADFIAWYENDGTPEVGAWPAHPVSSGPGSSISSFPWDADSDGDLDVLAAENDAFQVVWYENDGTPAVGAWTRHVISASQYPEWVVAADLDGDGDEDALSGAFFDDTIAWYEQQNVADPLDPDSDDDGLLDGAEIAVGANPLDPDSDDDGLGDGAEVNTYGSNPLLADTDGDAALDGSDNCPVTANPTQSDVGGLLASPPDGIGDACQCGDVNDDGLVDPTDVVTYRGSLADPAGLALTPAGVAKCSVIDAAGPCEVLDVSVIRRAIAAPPLGPGIAQVCTAARAP